MKPSIKDQKSFIEAKNSAYVPISDSSTIFHVERNGKRLI